MAVSGAGCRAKGHTFERWVAKKFRTALEGCDAKRGIQTRGGGSEVGDVVGTPYHIEVKVGVAHSPRAALRQAINDAAPGKLPVAIIKDDRKKPFVVMTFEDFLELAQECWELSEQ